MIYRRFKYLRSRLLLYYQDVLASTEKELDILDKRDVNNDPLNLCSRDRDDKQKRPRRKELFARLEEILKKYGILSTAFVPKG